MYLSPNKEEFQQNYRNYNNSNPKKFRNLIKIENDITSNNKIPIELTFVKNSGIFIRKLFIHKYKLDNTIKKLIKNGFYLYEPDKSVSKLSNIKTNNNNHINLDNVDFTRQGYNNSFQQKYLHEHTSTTVNAFVVNNNDKQTTAKNNNNRQENDWYQQYEWNKPIV